MKRKMDRLSDGELQQMIKKYHNDGKPDIDFLNEALMAQLILEIRESRTDGRG